VGAAGTVVVAGGLPWFVHLNRSSTFFTDVACHRPPRAVAIPRALRTSAMSRRDVAPAFLASGMIGSRWLRAGPRAP
jgi:hypothetical protein